MCKHNIDFSVELTHNTIPTEAELTQLLFIESMLTVLLSLAPKSIVSHQAKINYFSSLISQAPSLANLLDESKLLFTDIFNKKEISFLKKKITLENILSKNMDDIWWADASSNALQLIVLAKGTNNNTLLQLLNLVDNQTNYINIYDYVATQLRKLNYSSLNLSDDKAIINLVDLELVKYIAMPAAYGKTL